MDRLSRIIQELNSSGGFVKISDLAQQFDVTVRTIRNDLSFLDFALRNEDIVIEKNRGSGIRLSKPNLDDNELNSLIRRINGNKDYFLPNEREDLILEKLLCSKEPVTMQELESITLSSRTSLQKNLISCEEYLNKNDIKLIKKPHIGLVLEYSERSWRNVVLKHIEHLLKRMDFQQVYNNFSSGDIEKAKINLNEFTVHFIENVNLQSVVGYIRNYEKKYGIEFTDNSFVSIAIFICIAISRNHCNHPLNESNTSLANFFKRKHIDEIIDETTKPLNDVISVELNRNELECLLMFILSRKQRNSLNDYSSNALLEDMYFNEHSYQIVKTFISLIDEYLSVQLSNDEKLFNSMLLHIRPTIFRMLFGIKLENPLQEDIKKNYPEVFAACKFASSVIESETNSKISDNEISYLALHIEAAIEKTRERNFNGYYRTLIICPEGVGTSSILYYRLLNSIPNMIIERVCSINELNLVNKEDIDIVISTVPIYTDKKFNIVQVSPLLYEEDVQKIRQVLKKISVYRNSNVDMLVEDIITIVSKCSTIDNLEELKKNIGNYFDDLYADRMTKKPSLSTFLDDSLIELNVPVKDWKDAFVKTGSLLLNEDYISEEYINASIEAVEKYGPYMFIGDGIALMHARPEDGVKKTGFAFLTIDSPVSMDYNGVSYTISMVVCLSAKLDLLHLQAIGELIDITGSKSKMNALNEVKTKSEFIDFIKNSIDENLNMNNY